MFVYIIIAVVAVLLCICLVGLSLWLRRRQQQSRDSWSAASVEYPSSTGPRNLYDHVDSLVPNDDEPRHTRYEQTTAPFGDRRGSNSIDMVPQKRYDVVY